jgi:hypothetical protein
MEQPFAFFDQSGQFVDIQYNADSMHVVNQILEGANGKRCSVCDASPMRQTQVVWAESTRRHGTRTILLSNVALRVAPPRRPIEPSRRPPYYKAQWVYAAGLLGAALSIVGFIILCCGFTASSPSESSTDSGQVGSLMLLWLLMLVFFVGWIAMLIVGIRMIRQIYEKDSARRAVVLTNAEKEFALAMRLYAERLAHDRYLYERWKRSWFCTSCAVIVVEQPNATASRAP